MALTRTVSLKMFADTAAAQSKLNAIEAEARKLADLNPEIRPQIEKTAALRQMAVLRAELKAQGDKAGQDLGTAVSDGTKKGLGSKGGGSWIAAAIGLGAPLAGPLAAGGLAFGAFGALAAGSLKPVVTAMTGPGGLAAGWQTLDARQKTAAAGVEELKTRYDGLSKSMEPRAFQVFDTALSTASSLLGPLGRLADTSGAGVERFLVQFENDAGLQKFIGYASTIAPQAIGLLGTDVTTLVHSVLTLAQAMGGTGLLELRMLTSGLQILDKVISVLPGPLEGAALGVGGLAVGLSKIGVLAPLLKITGLANIGKDALAAAKGVEGLAIAERASAGAGAALDAVSPAGWALLATAAITGLAIWLGRLKTVTDKQVTSIEAATSAQGFNTAGYVAAAKAIGQANTEQEKQKTTLVNLHTGMTSATVDVGSLTGATQTLTAAQQANMAIGRNITTFLGALSEKYGITRSAAVTLAEKAGVLASQVGSGGRSMQDATTQAEAFANSMISAQNPAKTMNANLFVMGTVAARAASSVGQTNTAWDTFLSQSAAVETAELGIIGNLQQLDKDARKAGASFTGVNAASITLQTDFESNLQPGIQSLIGTMSNAHASSRDLAAVISTDLRKAVDAGALANKGMRQQIFDMATEAGYTGPNKIKPLTDFIDKNATSLHKAQLIADKYAASLAKIPSRESTSIVVHGSGQWAVTNAPGTGGKLIHAARGARVPGFGGGDQWPALLEGGETVVDKDTSRVLAPVFRAHGVPGYSGGGVAGKYSGSVPGMSKWLLSEDAATLRAIQSATAAAALAGIKAAQSKAQTFGGGLGKASLRQIEDWWMAAGGPGGGTAHVAAAITGAESGFNPRAVQQGQPYATTGWGLWQITPGNSEPQAGVNSQLLSGPANARAAVAKYRGAGGFSPWTTFEDGAYLRFMAAGGTAAPGWTAVGERGTELVRMHGGERVLSHSQSVQAGMGGFPGLASGTGGGSGTAVSGSSGGGGKVPSLTARQTAGLSLADYYRNPGSNASIRSEEVKYLHDIAKYFDGSSAKWRDAQVVRQTGKLTELGTKLNSINSRIASARSYQQSVRQGLSGYADLSGMTLGGAVVGMGSAAAQKQGGAKYLLTQEKGQLGNLKKFAGVLKKLSAAKVDSSLIRQVVALGPDDGTSFGEEILAGGPSLIKALNSTESAINATETQISRGAASAVYEGKYQPGKNFLSELNKEKTGLEKLFRDLGKELGEEASKWFKVPKARRPKGFARGGMLTEPVYGYGASGQPYTFAENGPERIVPGGVATTRSGPVVHIDHLHIRETADLGILSQKVGFAISAAGL